MNNINNGIYYNNYSDMNQTNMNMLHQNYYVQPTQTTTQTTNQTGSYRKTLNPSIYNAYRLSSNNPHRTNAPLVRI